MEQKTQTPNVVNRIPQMIAAGELTRQQVAAAIMGAGLSTDTVRRILEGETGFTLTTAAEIAKSLDTEISTIFPFSE